ncbi:hypothetical protein BDF20DRAFT_857113 [Mycotypha africana]|uniref:uncharacterized protein n=1 Tax=Mycotypha africana TaxID=64632 RepID=UPI0022FFCFBC|nr:uncharacterized protein BDF20DRAFT_857113 [Mycotypha africana]KAI8983939.1 hypothetical protein BDF20DRAFT_857113 [Mycotypha africana]
MDILRTVLFSMKIVCSQLVKLLLSVIFGCLPFLGRRGTQKHKTMYRAINSPSDSLFLPTVNCLFALSTQLLQSGFLID